MVTHQADAGWAHFLIERADGDQWRMTEVGYGGFARCGMRRCGEADGRRRDGGAPRVRLRDRGRCDGGQKGEMVDCADGHDCTTACGEDRSWWSTICLARETRIRWWCHAHRTTTWRSLCRGTRRGWWVAGAIREIALVKP